uniref:Uncharacterized protein n=1 Tax=Cucumis melo TaxID=3656 RepID=A0A9I9ELU7_CUCME
EFSSVRSSAYILGSAKSVPSLCAEAFFLSGSRMKNIKSNKDEPTVIDDNTEEEVRNKEPIEYQPLQTIYPEDDEEEFRGPTGTKIVVYQDQKLKKTNVINEGETSYDVPLNFSSESDEDNVSIAKRRLFKRVLNGKGKETSTVNVCI